MAKRTLKEKEVVNYLQGEGFKEIKADKVRLRILAVKKRQSIKLTAFLNKVNKIYLIKTIFFASVKFSVLNL